MYTVVTWISSGTYIYAITSDYISHDKYAVHHFNDLIVSDLRKRMNGSLNAVDIFSDAAAQQFKQKFTFLSAALPYEQGTQMNWHFFVESAVSDLVTWRKPGWGESFDGQERQTRVHTPVQATVCPKSLRMEFQAF